ncbi:uncharacterized protein LOC132271233 [Cornus florida]|uniref:uncharacterized protein LOC132271233 n=1 Tax=Cornus florida TaxID=4283 RepID=UPI0028A01669|nr:uncharacterized protein LOC132271233 [Cornus florida]XP_059628539.1 uncharacterized protein LOC132271233 [Cornus florida]XP_059628540.1 uncharacterized protein LOC132271233 [Cornus florida]
MNEVDGAEGLDSISMDNSVGEEHQSLDDITSTPLRRYVTMVGTKKDNKWICNFGCKSEPYTGTYSRVRAHLIGLFPGQKKQGVAICSKVKKDEREKMKKEELAAKSLYGSNSRKPPLSSLPIVPPSSTANSVGELGTQNIGNLFKLSSRDETDSIVARYYYSCGISFNVARSPLWTDAVRAINNAPRGYRAPSSEKIRTILLDKERTKIDNALMPIKQNWPKYGVSIVSDGWSNCKNQPLINVLAVSRGRPVFVTAVDCSGDEKTAQYISEILLKVIETVGTYSVVQILTDNASTCKVAGDIIQARHSHILWSGCMAHTLSLLMKDIANSTNPLLTLVGTCYAKAKGVVNYIKNHSFALYIFRTFSALEVIQVKKTRFGHHFVVLDRLFRVKNALISAVLSEEWEALKKGTSRSKLEHDQIKKIVLDDEFWKDLKFVLSFTKPIWNMIRFCDSDRAVVGEVYQRMEDMLGHIEAALSNKFEMCTEVKALVIARWARMNLPLHTLAYVLTPFYYSNSWLTSVGPNGKERMKPHANLFVQGSYLNVVDRLVRDPRDAPLIRQQLSDFTSDEGVFARPQSIEDRKMMSAVAWWNLYGVAAPELYALAIKVLSQTVNTSCAERVWSTYGYIHSVKRNKLNADRAESLVYVHYNNRLLTRYREDYEKSYTNWDDFAYEDDLDNDLESIDKREQATLYADEIEASSSSLDNATSSTSLPSTQGANMSQTSRREEIS